MRTVWSRRALRHLVEIRSHIPMDHARDGRQVAARILESVDRLAGYPHVGPSGRAIGTRELVVAGTPYVILYRVKDYRLQLIAVFSRQTGGAD